MPRYTPLTANTVMNPRLQKPIKLCKCQITRFHPMPRGSVRLRRHVLIPGHQITSPVPASASTARAPTPFTSRPVGPASKLSCRSSRFDTSQTPVGTDSPRSLPLRGSNSLFLARSVCLSCCGRRMVDTAAHLADRVFPRVPVRQWVLSLPFALRYRLAYDSTMTTAVLQVFIRSLFVVYRRLAENYGIDQDPVRRGHFRTEVWVGRESSCPFS